MDRNLRNQHQMMSSANIPKRHSSHQHSHSQHMHSQASQQQHHPHHHQQQQHHSVVHQQQQQQQQQHHHHHNQQSYNSSANSAASSTSSGVQQNEDVIKYIEDAWHKVTSEHGSYGNGTRYYNHVPNPRLLANFQPFNLEDFWGQKVVRNLSHITRGNQQQ